MKRYDILPKLISVLFFSLFVINSSAQELLAPEGYEYVDSVVYIPAATVDTTLVGRDIISDMPSRVKGDAATVSIDQSDLVARSVRSHVQSNADRTISGYRVRIFFDNKQSARHESENSLKKFRSMYPDVAAYRTYTNPYFKVTVGDCRTRSEAMALLKRIKRTFPSAFVVKENIEYPVVDKDNAYVVDTVQVLRSVVTIEQ